MLGRAIPGTMAVVLAAMAVAAVAVTMLSVVQTPVGRVELVLSSPPSFRGHSPHP